MNHKELIATACMSWISFSVLGGCSSQPETQNAPPSTPPAPAARQSPPQMEFETRTDTIHTQRSKTGEPAMTGNREPQIRYMVQIGAFKDPHNASRVQVSARNRYHMPVLNDYDIAHGYYQIRIGFFESEQAAQTFCVQLQKEHPKDYKDSWVVPLKR